MTVPASLRPAVFDMAMARAPGVRAVGVAWGHHDVRAAALPALLELP